jgi:hypothetical protein
MRTFAPSSREPTSMTQKLVGHLHRVAASTAPGPMKRCFLRGGRYVCHYLYEIFFEVQ